MRRRREASPGQTAAGTTLLLGLLFALSGAAALIDQVVWTRWLNLTLGSGTYAAVVVLATFMGGLGLGAAIAGLVGDRAPTRALLLFAAAEGIVGLWSLLSIPLLGDLLPRWTASLAGAELEGYPLLTRAGLATTVLLLPTLAMGATLPLLARWAVSARQLPGRGVGLLYALNTLGGAAGALAATFYIVERLGLSGAVGVAAGLDLTVAAAALWLGRRSVEPSRAAPRKEREEPPEALPLPRAALAGVSVGFFVSGAVGLALEVAAHRVIAVLSGSSSYAFTTMLAAFLVGIALGSLVARRWADRAAAPGAWIAMGLAGLGLGTGLAAWSFGGGAFRGVGRAVAGVFSRAGDSWSTELVGSFLTLLPATLMLGFIVPFVARIAGAVPGRVTRRFGLAYALNTLGAVAGTLFAGLWGIPALGSAGLLRVLVGCCAAAALVVAVTCVPRARRLRSVAATVVLCALGLGAATGADPVRQGLLGRFAAPQVLFFDEGPVQTIAVVKEDNFQQLDFLRLITNQTSLTGTHLYARRYMRLLGHLPVLYARSPQRALVICLGTGMTAAAVASHPAVEELAIAEISPEVVRALPLFDQVNDSVAGDPRTRLRIADGRHLLQASSLPWDVITLEPPPPRDSGVVSLYTTEFYRLCRSRLRPGGVVAQWIPLHSQSGDEVRMLLRSFLEAFPYALGFLPVERDLIVLGSDSPLVADPAELRRRASVPGAGESLRAIGFEDSAALLAAALFDRDDLERIAGDAPAVTDDRPRVEYFARYGRRPALPPVADWLDTPPPATELLGGVSPAPDWNRRFETDRASLLALNRAAWAAEQGRAGEGERLRLEALRLRPDDLYVRWAAGLSDEHLERLRERARRRPRDVAAWRTLALRLGDRGLLREAGDAYRQALEVAPNDVETLLALGNFLIGRGGRPAAAKRVLRRVLELAPGHPAAPAIRGLLGAGAPPAGGPPAAGKPRPGRRSRVDGG